jgi:hypothetical protein
MSRITKALAATPALAALLVACVLTARAIPLVG